MDVFGCSGPPTKFESFMVCVCVIGIALCFLALFALFVLVLLGLVQ